LIESHQPKRRHCELLRSNPSFLLVGEEQYMDCFARARNDDRIVSVSAMVGQDLRHEMQLVASRFKTFQPLHTVDSNPLQQNSHRRVTILPLSKADMKN